MKTQQSLKVKSGTNFRELGGYQTSDGHTVKSHKLLRSASLGALSKPDLQYLSDYGVHYDIDLRSADEQAKVPDRVPPKTQYVFNPVFAVDLTRASKFSDAEEQSQSVQEAEALQEIPDNGHASMLKTYQDIINLDSAKQAYQTFFQYLLANDQPQQSVLFHCTAGKDRTGIGAAFILTALGVPYETIKQDYLLTNVASKEYVDHQLAHLKADGLNPKQLTSAKALLTVSPDYLRIADAEIKQAAGSWLNFIQTDLKVTDQDLKDLKQIYLD
ncbi:tyrosine-protein phosphatase [Bombilactobacillus folatiphilus]|uniref:Tyrosine-protein phosphatase n=1 Tax=Bombilactobacillus folatiphilus TaxID=2923362 RepID=A0ABY4P8N0_9LACO|nr:tyrosine-protein phosphatase [Bombilactobacillus folatiphilus]UQS82013.1 tyrosine-protein phosphatase [Bombilactobacillus folatiphilus]